MARLVTCIAALALTLGVTFVVLPPGALAQTSGGNIAGKVTAAGSGAALSGICVHARSIDGDASSLVATRSDGTYSLVGLPSGAYHVAFIPAGPVCAGGVSQNYLRQWSANQSSASTAGAVSVTAGSKTRSIDASLRPGGKIVGTVTSTPAGRDLSGICVNAVELNGGASGTDVTSSDGRYAIIGLPTGTYKLKFGGCGQNEVTVHAQTAVTAGSKSRVDATMEVGPPPAAAPVTWCETGLPTSPYTTAPAGSVTIPAGDDSNTPPAQNYTVQPNTVYWFAPGVHTFGSSGQYAQFEGKSGDTFVGAPGAILDGQNTQEYAITGDQTSDTNNVTVEYLQIQHFVAGTGEAVVGQDALDGWTIRDNLIEDNPYGAGAQVVSDGVVTDNCLQRNGEYGYTAESANGAEHNATLTDNDINDNNNASYYDLPGSTVQCGCSGGGKFWQTINATVTGNYIHDNLGPGIWVDTANAGFNISRNYIANNWGEGVVYEISYNANISNNTFVGNAWGEVQTNAAPSFAVGAIYISNSGGDNRVTSNYAGHISISGNTLTQNWGGIVLYQDANRICGFSPDGVCTLVDPGTYTLSSCKANITSSSSPSQSPDYYDNCQWKTQNVSVADNTETFKPSTLPNVMKSGATDTCASANANDNTLCGFNGLFSYYGSVKPFTGTEQDTAISDKQNNVFSKNTYIGPIRFSAFNQSNNVSWAQWSRGFSYSGGGTFGAQDAGSTFASS